MTPVVAHQRNQRAARVAISELTQQGVVGERKEGAVVFPVRQGNRSWHARDSGGRASGCARKDWPRQPE